MGFGYKRSDLRSNAQAKLDDAILLFEHGRFSNAYYLAGFSVELALKACIAAQITAETIPDKALLRDFLIHDYRKLIGLAGLATALKEREDGDQDFAANWAVVREWVPDVRYEARDVTSTQTIIEAINDPNSGVFGWIKTYW